MSSFVPWHLCPPRLRISPLGSRSPPRDTRPVPAPAQDSSLYSAVICPRPNVQCKTDRIPKSLVYASLWSGKVYGLGPGVQSTSIEYNRNSLFWPVKSHLDSLLVWCSVANERRNQSNLAGPRSRQAHTAVLNCRRRHVKLRIIEDPHRAASDVRKSTAYSVESGRSRHHKCISCLSILLVHPSRDASS